MERYRKLMHQIKPGEIVAGQRSGWWRITEIATCRDGSVILHGRHVDTGNPGQLWDTPDAVRDLTR